MHKDKPGSIPVTVWFTCTVDEWKPDLRNLDFLQFPDKFKPQKIKWGLFNTNENGQG